jgi:hypothetical protein
MIYNRIIAGFWIVAAAWLAWGVSSQAWRDRSEGLHGNPEWLIVVVLCLSVFTACASYTVFRGRTWAVWFLVVMASLVLGDTLLCLMMEGCSFELGTIPFVALPLLTFLSPVFLKRNERVA